MKIPLEDNSHDIVGKAQRGLKLPGETDPGKLGLNAAALRAIAEGAWYPNDPGKIDGLAMFNTPYGDMTVNAYVIFDPVTTVAAAFDTGADCSGMLQLNVKIQQIFLTHAHGDHILDLPRLKKATGAPAYIGDRENFDEAQGFAAGRQFQVGKLKVETRLTCGHSRGGITYVVCGLTHPVAVVGDAMFAGSMGGGMVSYEDALRTNREQILTLPDDTILCCGHGPLTTVGEEKLHNPFFTA